MLQRLTKCHFACSAAPLGATISRLSRPSLVRCAPFPRVVCSILVLRSRVLCSSCVHVLRLSNNRFQSQITVLLIQIHSERSYKQFMVRLSSPTTHTHFPSPSETRIRLCTTPNPRFPPVPIRMAVAAAYCTTTWHMDVMSCHVMSRLLA